MPRHPILSQSHLDSSSLCAGGGRTGCGVAASCLPPASPEPAEPSLATSHPSSSCSLTPAPPFSTSPATPDNPTIAFHAFFLVWENTRIRGWIGGRPHNRRPLCLAKLARSLNIQHKITQQNMTLDANRSNIWIWFPLWKKSFEK